MMGKTHLLYPRGLELSAFLESSQAFGLLQLFLPRLPLRFLSPSVSKTSPEKNKQMKEYA